MPPGLDVKSENETPFLRSTMTGLVGQPQAKADNWTVDLLIIWCRC